MPQEHRLVGNALKADNTDWPTFSALCVCGWASRPFFSRALAMIHFRDHQTYPAKAQAAQ